MPKTETLEEKCSAETREGAEFENSGASFIFHEHKFSGHLIPDFRIRPPAPRVQVMAERVWTDSRTDPKSLLEQEGADY